jgi:hypothetical protein
MPPMRNVFNMITDGFKRMGLDECNYIVSVYSNVITIKNSLRTRVAELKYRCNGRGELVDYQDSNNLFANNRWDNFCYVFERELPEEFDYDAFVQALVNQANTLGTNAWIT